MPWTPGQTLTAAEMGAVVGTIVATSASVNPCVIGNEYLVTTGASNLTYTLPSAAPLAGQCVGFTKVDAGTGKLTVTAGGTSLLMGPGLATAGQTSMSFIGPGSFVVFQYDGTNWHIASSSPQVPVYRARVYRAASVAVASSSAFPYDTTVFDVNGNMTSMGTGSCGFLCPVPGYYRVDACAASSTSGVWQLMLFKAGVADSVGNSVPSAAARQSAMVHALVKCAANDLLQLVNYGAASITTIASTGFDNWMTVEYIGP